jgi:hypothetical protein
MYNFERYEIKQDSKTNLISCNDTVTKVIVVLDEDMAEAIAKWYWEIKGDKLCY